MRTRSVLSVLVVTLFTLIGFASFLKASERIPFRLYRGYLILAKGSIGPLEDLTFLIDTGATSTCLSPHVAKKLRIQRRVKKAAAYSGEVQVEFALLHDIRLGSKEFDFIPTLITDLSFLPDIGNHIDAIIGMNLLKRAGSLRIDYRERTLSLGSPIELPHSTRLDCPELFPVITVQVEGSPLRLLLDTGAREMILFRKRLDDFPRLSSTLIHKTIHHLGGVDKIRRAVLDEVNLGSMSWDRLKIYLLDSPVAEYEGVEGLTGISALGFTSIQLDFRSQRFSWVD